MSEAGKVTDWQRRLLPLMVIVLLVLAAFACIANLYQARVVQTQAMEQEKLDFSPVWQSLDRPLASDLAYAQWKTAVMLESAAMHRRFHQASVITLTRIYIVFLGFMSGMVMALIGSTFILGKLDAPGSRLEAEATGWKFVLLTSSPGILLVVLGTTLMVVTILARAEVQVTEAALYLPQFEVLQGGAAPGSEVGWEEKQGILRKVKTEDEKKQEP